ncbi:MAG: alpha/beta fold hydrolase [Thaumarchaeota archaeon]|nr:alpha/beta fold hydrolase [Nitrososphaerota archaeon]
MSTFVLIHGALHGGWCWYKVVPLLERQGHTVLALDLPSHGRDKTPIAAVSLQAYVDSVCQVLDAQQEPVILVGHSMGGGIITQVAEQRPDKIKTLVYVAALLPQDGEAMFQLLQRDTAAVQDNFVLAADQSYLTLRDGNLKERVYSDCTDEDAALGKVLLVPQATAPLMTPLHTSAANFGRVPRVYMECLRDSSLALQRQLYTALPCRQVISLDTGHFPMLSTPKELAAHLAAL